MGRKFGRQLTVPGRDEDFLVNSVLSVYTEFTEAGGRDQDGYLQS